MIFTPQVLIDIQKGFDTLFQRGYANKDIPTLAPLKADRVDTKGKKINLYGWMAETPMFRKWVGDRVVKRLKARGYSLTNEDYEVSFSIGMDDIKYDMLGVYTPRVEAHGRAARVLWDQVLTTAQADGLTATCYDGQYFYDTDHPVSLEDSSLGTFSNKFTSTALTLDNFRTVYATMANLKDANGEPFGAIPTILEVAVAQGPLAREIVQNALVAKNVLQSTTVVGGVVIPNVMQNVVSVVENPRIAAGTWYLHSTNLMKPFVLQVESDPSGLVSRVDPTSENVFYRKEFEFGATATGAVGYTLPQLSSYCAA